MRDGMRSVRLTVGSLAIAVAFSGCAGSSWQFWKTSSSADAPAEPAVATTNPAAPTAPAPSRVATATPEPNAETTARPALSSDFVELPALADVRFRPGLITVGKADAKALDAVVRWLTENPGAEVRIEGHTDDLGNQASNLAVGEKRAMSVMRYLVSKGLEPHRISIVSYGSARPVCAEKTEICRAKNRRAHFLVKRP